MQTVKTNIMEALSDLKTFAKILTDKGYRGYFHTQGAYAGKLKDSIGDYLANNRKNLGKTFKQELLVTGCLLWTDIDVPGVECSMWIRYFNGKFFLHRMEVTRKDPSGRLLKQERLSNLSAVFAVPKAKKLIAMVGSIPKQRAISKSKAFGH